MATRPAISTDRQVSALRPGPNPYEVSVSGARGLAVRIFPSGTKSFEFRYVAPNGVRRRLPLGNYPGLTLAEAREDAGALRVAVTRGTDPAAERAAARTSARTGDTLSELAEIYFQAAAKGLHGGRGRPKKVLTLKVERNRFDQHIRSRLGHRRLTEIKRTDVKVLMRELAGSGKLAPDTVASIGGTLSAILSFAVHEERLESNPALGLTRPLALKSRERMFDEDSLASLWKALAGVSTLPPSPRSQRAKRLPIEGEECMRARADLAVALALRFAMLTLARRNDVASARWEEIDLKRAIWTIPAARFKNGRAHVVPLSEAALAILVEAGKLPGGEGVVVFPSPTSRSAANSRSPRPITPSSLTRALRRTLADSGLPHGSPHDFRRAGATTLTSERYGFRQFVVGKVLGHSTHDGAAITSVYDRNDYLREKRSALDAWACHILNLASSYPPGSNVVELRHGERA